MRSRIGAWRGPQTRQRTRMSVQQDRRLCRWYGHKVVIDVSTIYEPPQIQVRCRRCQVMVAGPYVAWGGRELTTKELLTRSLFKTNPVYTRLTGRRGA